MWVTVALGTAFIMLFAWLWRAQQEGARGTARKLEELVNEARMVSQDMEAMLSSAVDLSRNVVDDLELRLQSAPNPAAAPRETPEIQADRPDPVMQFYREIAMESSAGAVPLPEADRSCHEPALTTPIEEPQTPAANAWPDSNFEAYRNMHPTLAVNQLYNQGLDAKQIAQILHRGQGEIHLILNLSRKKKMDKAT